MVTKGKTGSYNKILEICYIPKTFSEIKSGINQKDGVVVNALSNLQKRGLITKGNKTYRLTDHGALYLIHKHDRLEDIEPDEERKFDLVSINLLYHEHFDSFLNIWIPTVKFVLRDKNIRALSKILKVVYDAVAEREATWELEHKDATIREHAKKLVWMTLKEKPLYFDKILDIQKINEICSKKRKSEVTLEEVFHVLKVFSLPLGERLKRNFKRDFLGKRQ